jgi:hypothetical protein
VASAAPPPDVEAGWASALDRLRGRKRLASVLLDARPLELEEDRLTIAVPNGNAYIRDTLEDVETRRLISETATAVFGRRLRLEYRYVEGGKPPAGGESSEGAAARLRDHPLVQEALGLLGGSVVREIRG